MVIVSKLFRQCCGWAMVCSLLLLTPDTSWADDPPQTPEIWTPQQAVIFGLKNSPDSRIASQRIAAAQANRNQAKSRLYHPRIDLSATYGQTNNPIYSFGNILNQGTFNQQIDFNNPGRTDDLNLKAELSYRFYNGGSDQAIVEAAESGYLGSESSKREIEHRLGFEIVRAYQNIVQAMDQVEARKAELEAIELSLAVAEARYEAGDLLKTEVLNFEVQKSRTRENLIIANHQQELTEKIFLNLLGLEQGQVNISANTEIDQVVPQQEHYIERPELAVLTARLQAAEAELKQVQGRNLPTLDGFASYQYDKGWVNDGSGDSWIAGVKLNYNIWDGKQTNAEIDRKQAEYRELKEQLHKLILGINLDIQEAELNYNQALQRRSVTDKMVEVARESAQLSRERFKEGVILSSDLLDTEVRLTDTLVRQSSARANYSVAIANLRRASGHQQFRNTTEELLENQP